MAFHLTRFLDQPASQDLEPGGSFTMGFINQSLYTGDIEYTPIPPGSASYWILSLQSLTVQGNQISVPSGSSSYAAIDTGTTLVGGPSSIISQIYAQIPGSSKGTGSYDGYYLFPCNTNVSISLNFGGRDWTVSPSDFLLTQLTPTGCLGAFFELDMSGGSTPTWIVGDTFLKNVFTVFQYDPPAVGFATLSDVALEIADVNGAIPSPTLGSVAAAVTAAGVDNNVRMNDGKRARGVSGGVLAGLSAITAIMVTGSLSDML